MAGRAELAATNDNQTRRFWQRCESGESIVEQRRSEYQQQNN
jgi:hypothetical protein